MSAPSQIGWIGFTIAEINFNRGEAETMSEFQKIFEVTERVNGYECDFSQHWKPAAFFQHLTEAASLHAERLGFGFDAMLEQDLFWVHSRMKIKFFEFPKISDLVTIRTWPKTIQQKLFFIRDFEVLNSAGGRIAAATSAWLVINATTRRMLPPQSLNFNLPKTPELDGLDEPLEKLGLTQSGEERLLVKAGYSAVDMVGHVNNSRYVEWICDTFSLDDYRRRSLDWMQVNYDHEIRPGEEVALLVNQPETMDANYWTVEGINRSNSSQAFECALHWRDRAL